MPEDRLATGVSSPADITENLIMGRHRSRALTRFGFHLGKKAAKDYAGRLFRQYDIRAASLMFPWAVSPAAMCKKGGHCPGVFL